jgi:hypothetical protein
MALKVFSGKKLATIYFCRAVGWSNAKAIADTTEALRLRPDQAPYKMRLHRSRQRRIRYRHRRFSRPPLACLCGSSFGSAIVQNNLF